MFFRTRRPVEEVYRKSDLLRRKARSANKSTLCELFASFIAYYAGFDFAHRVISIRRGRLSHIDRQVCCLPPCKRARLASSFKIFVEGSKKFMMARAGPKMDYLSGLSAQIERFFQSSCQTSETLDTKMGIRNNLQSAILLDFPNSKLFIVGSSISGFGSNRGDLDLCLVVKEQEFESKEYSCTVLSEVKSLLLDNGSIRNCRLIPARVPILRFCDRQSGIACDMGVNNVSGIYNTHLLAMYARVDPRLPPLGVFVKHWALRMRIHGANLGRLNTCALLLMVIQYLQCGCSPPVLPNLQSLFPSTFDSKCPVDELDMDLQLPWEDVCSVSKSTLGELFTGFIAYYADFEFDRWAISVRCGQPFPLDEVPSWFATFRGRRGRGKYRIFVEDPFRKDNVARSIFRRKVVETIQGAFRRTDKVLRDRKPLDSLWMEAPPPFTASKDARIKRN